MATMTLYPAIDLMNGRCVRLHQGDFAQAEVFAGDPVEVALGWRAAGAEWLHVVDLDGALAGEPKHLDLLRAIAEATKLPIQAGGGLRNEAAVEAAFAAGAERVILGTAALRHPELLAVCLNRWGRRMAVSVDSRGGRVVVAGWLENVAESAVEFASRMADAGVKTLIMTNVERDGTLAGTDLSALRAARAALPGSELIAAGGISSVGDVRALAESGIDGAVLGRAIYAGTLDLAEALRAVRETETQATAEMPRAETSDPGATDAPAGGEGA